MGVGLVLSLVILLAVVIGVVAIVRRLISRPQSTPQDGHDIVAYLVLALAMSVAGFAFAGLVNAAFPSGGLIVDPASDLAASLPALIVASPFVVFFWRRQAERRLQFPDSVGWGIYLSIVLLIFGIAFAVAAVLFFNGVFGDGRVELTNALVFGALVGLHEFAARHSPPQGDAGEIHRLIGSAIGLFTLGVGLVGTIGALLTALFDAGGSELPGPEWLPWVSMVLVGGPIWIYFWFRQWKEGPGLPRHVWLVAISSGSIVTALVGVVGALVLIIEWAAGDGGSSEEAIPFLLAAAVVGFATWLIHRRDLGSERVNSVRAYEYLVAAVALISAVGAGVTLTQFALGDRTLVGGDAFDVLSATLWLIASVSTWLWFHQRSYQGSPEEEATAWPRRLYLLGVGAVMGVGAAIALIAALVVVAQRLFENSDDGNLIIPLATFLFAGVAAWYLLTLYFKNREYTELKEVATPFEVTIVCSHPGPLGTMFPKQARIRVVYRSDGQGVITEETAESIVELVGHNSSHVWVDDEGVRVAQVRSL